MKRLPDMYAEMLWDIAPLPREQRTEMLELLAHRMIRRRHTRYLSRIARAYSAIRKRNGDLVEVTVDSAFPFSEEDARGLKSSCETTLGKTVELHTSLDPDLIGGGRIRVNDRLHDFSLRNALHQLMLRLT